MKKVDWKKVNEVLAISQGQWVDNGYPIVFKLVTMIDDDEMHLIIYQKQNKKYFRNCMMKLKKNLDMV